MNSEVTRTRLFSDFPEVPADAWAEKIKQDLKGASPDTLLWQSYEGLTVKPFYTAEDNPNHAPLQNIPGKFPFIRGHKTGQNTWQNLPEITVGPNSHPAITKAAQAIATRADGVHFIVEHPDNFDFEYLIAALDLTKITLAFTLSTKATTFINSFFAQLQAHQISPHGLKGFINTTPALVPDNALPDYQQLETILERTKDAVDFYGVTVNGAVFGNRGANAVQELAFCLSAAVDYTSTLSAAGIPLSTIFRNLQVLISISPNYFFEIAKLRALRWLWSGVVKTYGEEPSLAASLRIHAQTARWSATTFDPHSNILRYTTEAMSAIMGGCDSLSIASFDITFNPQNPFAERISQNIPLILKHEAYLDQAIDPAGGSYYLEALTQELAEKAWALFKEIEDRGGYAKVWQNGFITEQINQSAEERFKNIASGREVLVGTNKFANKNEKIDFDPEALLQSTYFDTTRASYPFEVMRLAALLHFRKKKARPKAIIAIVGNDIQEHIHAAFAKEFFACGDFDTETLTFDSVPAALEKLLFTDCKVIVFSSTQRDYTQFSAHFTQALKNHPHRPILILAAPPEDMKEELEENGFDGRIFQNCNTKSIIVRIQERLLNYELL